MRPPGQPTNSQPPIFVGLILEKPYNFGLFHDRIKFGDFKDRNPPFKFQ